MTHHVNVLNTSVMQNLVVSRFQIVDSGLVLAQDSAGVVLHTYPRSRES